MLLMPSSFWGRWVESGGHETENIRHNLQTAADHSKNKRERRQMVPNKSISLSHLALIVILVIVLNAFLTYGEFQN